MPVAAPPAAALATPTTSSASAATAATPALAAALRCCLLLAHVPLEVHGLSLSHEASTFQPIMDPSSKTLDQLTVCIRLVGTLPLPEASVRTMDTLKPWPSIRWRFLDLLPPTLSRVPTTMPDRSNV